MAANQSVPDLFKAVMGLASQLTSQISEADQRRLKTLPPTEIFAELSQKLLSQSVMNQMTQAMTVASGPSSAPGTPKKSSSKSKSKPKPKPKQIKAEAEAAEAAEESDEESSENDICPRTTDIHLTLNVTLEDMYMGKKKHIKLKRKQFRNDNEIYEEEKKLSVPIHPGIAEGHTMYYKGESHRIPNYVPGDIVVTLQQTEHEYFDREGNNLFLMLNISLGEVYSLNQRITHLDGRVLLLSSDNDPLFQHDGIRKIPNEGMPFYNDPEGRRGDLFVRFNIVLPDSLTQPDIDTLLKLAPPFTDPEDPSEDPSGSDDPVPDPVVVVLERVSEKDMEEFENQYTSDSDSDTTDDTSDTSDDSDRRRSDDDIDDLCEIIDNDNNSEEELPKKTTTTKQR